MTPSTDNGLSEWSCDDRDSRGACRNPHGCHCAEITALRRQVNAARASSIPHGVGDLQPGDLTLASMVLEGARWTGRSIKDTRAGRERNARIDRILAALGNKGEGDAN